MADFSKKTQSDNKHLSNLTTARSSIHIDGSNTNPIVIRPKAGRLMRIIIMAKGLAFTVRDGSDIKAVVATTTLENSYEFGIYCNTNITINGISGTGSALIVFDE